MKLRSILATLLLCASTAAQAVAPTAIYSLPNIAAFANQNLASKGAITTAGYWAAGDGGGNVYDFSSTPCTADGGSCIHDGAGNSFVARTIRDAKQYGVTSGSIYDWITNHTTASDITPVLNAMAAAGVGKLDLAGVATYMKTDYTIQSGDELTCSVPVGPVASTAWYNDIPGAIYQKHGVTFTTTGRTLSWHNCFLFPDWVTTANIPVDAATTRAVLDNMVSNGDTGFVCQSQGCNIHDVFIAGFDNPFWITHASANSFTDSYLDGNVGAWVNSTGGAANWSHLNVFDYLTKNSPQKQLRYSITAVADDGTGQCKLTITPKDAGTGAGQETLADLTSANYGWVSSLSNGPSACEGRWTPGAIDTGAGTIVLTGSAVAGPETYCHWPVNSYVIYCSNQTNIRNGETITGHSGASLASNGIPDSTTVLSPIRLPLQRSYIFDSGGAANTYVANDDPTIQPCTLADITNVPFDAAHTNTGASTLNITLNSATGCTGGTTGAIAIVHQDGSALTANDILAGAHVLVRYSAALSKWILIQPKVILSTKTTVAQSTNVQVVFNGGTCSGSCGTNPEFIVDFTARIDAGTSPAGVAAGGIGHAKGIFVGGPIPKELPNTDRVAGLQCNGCAVFNHATFEDIWNSNEISFHDAGNDSEGDTDDPYTINFYIHGESNNVHINGKKFVKGGGGVLVSNITYPDSSDRGCINVSGVGFAATAAFDPIIDAEQGCVTIDGSVTNSTGLNFISNFMNFVGLNNVYQPQVTTYYEGAAAMAATCTIGSVLAGGMTCSSNGILGTNIFGQSISSSSDVALILGYNGITNTHGSFINDNLPPVPADGDVVIVKDEGGNAGTVGPQRVVPASGTIEGNSYITIDVNGGGVKLRWSATDSAWFQIP